MQKSLCLSDNDLFLTQGVRLSYIVGEETEIRGKVFFQIDVENKGIQGFLKEILNLFILFILEVTI